MSMFAMVGSVASQGGATIPGPADLIAGTMTAGYFGLVQTSELFTGTELSAVLGITEGVIQHDTTPWLKFAIDGNIIFKSQKTYRSNISWTHLNAHSAVYGNRTIEREGLIYKIRLMKSDNEWERLMYPIHVNYNYWGIGFTDTDLNLIRAGTAGVNYGSYTWCQETVNTHNRARRGYFGVVAKSSNHPTSPSEDEGWSPVLELVL